MQLKGEAYRRVVWFKGPKLGIFVPSTSMGSRIFLLGLIASWTVCSRPAKADDLSPALVGAIRDTQTKQQEIQGEANSVVGQIDAILAEYRQHGMESRDDVKTLQAIRGVLAMMSAAEIQQVIGLLQQAKSATSSNTALHQSAQASVTQAAIVDQLKKLLALHARQERQFELAARLQQLAKRQDMNLDDLLDANREKLAGHNADTLHDTLNLQKQQQDQLANDVQAALDELNAMNVSADTSDRLHRAIEQARGDAAGEKAALASSELAAGHIFQAAAAEKSARDSLRETARILVVPNDTLSEMKQALADIDKAIADQKESNSQTQRALAGRIDPAELTALEKKQAANVDQTDQIQKSLNAVSPRASYDLKQAIDNMQDARTDLNQHRKADLAQKQASALENLQAARQDLQNQTDKLQASTDPQLKTQAGSVEHARDLKAQADALKQKQTALNQQTDQKLNHHQRQDAKDSQSQLHQAALDLQQQAMESAPAAAPAMGEAAKKMDAAAKDLARSGADQEDAADQQRQAIAALDRGEQAIDQRIAQLQQEQKDADTVGKDLPELTRIILAQQTLAVQTDAAAAKQDDAAVKPLETDEASLSHDTASLRDSLPESAGDAASPLGDARFDMGQSAAALGKPSAGEAVASQRQALVDLSRAQDALVKKKADLDHDLGKQDDKTGGAEAALGKLDNAIAETNAANEQLTKSAESDSPAKDPKSESPIAVQLQKQQQEIAGQLKQMQQDPQTAGASLQQAQRAAEQAAKELTDNQPARAAQSMQQATAAMQQASPGQAAKKQEQQRDGKSVTNLATAKEDQPLEQEPNAPQTNGQGTTPDSQPSKEAAGEDAEKSNEPGQKQEQQHPGKQLSGEKIAGGQAPGEKAGEDKKADAAARNQPALAEHRGDEHQAAVPNAADGAKLVDLIERQQKLEAAAEALKPEIPARLLGAAQQQVGQINASVSETVPPDAQQALQKAEQELSQAAARAAAGDAQAAQAAAQSAAQEMQQAKTAMIMAQGGPPQSGQSGQSEPMPGPDAGAKPDKTSENGALGGKGNRKDTGRGVDDGGPRNDVVSDSQYQALPARDRAALKQSRADKYPQEYAPQVEQYLKNLADDETKK